VARQPGHEKHERALIPTDQCDDMHPCKPEQCRRCGAKLSGNDPEPLRHQVWEVPATTGTMRRMVPRRCPNPS
jgi:transposase